MVITNSSTLNDRYAIQSVLGEVGPFDVSYLAWDLEDECEVVLREYYPLQFSKRASDGLTLEVNDPKNFEYGLGAYTAEAHRLIDINHPSVINYQSNFKENGTIYSVSTFTAGASAYGYMTQQGGALGEEEALSIVGQVIEGLQSCHANNLYHGGVWPKAIHLTPEGMPVLMGFSQACFQLAKHCDKFEQVHLPGFTAPEQAYKEVDAGPWWDIFGAAATLFYMLSGYQLNYQREKCTEEDIQSALHRETSISADLRPVLEKALAFNYKNRFETLDGFQHALEEATAHKTLLSMHTNGHHTNGQSYATSVSALPESVINPAASSDDIIDVREVRALPPQTEQVEDPVQPAPQETTSKMEKDDKPTVQVVDAPPQTEELNTSIVQQDQTRSPILLEQPKEAEPQPTTEKSDKEVAQLLSKMVKWQQTLIAFILGFVFLVLLTGLAIFAGPQLMDMVKSSTSGAKTDIQSAVLAAASSAPLATVDSTGESITQSDIDSMYASIRAQLEEEMGVNQSVQTEAITARQPEPSLIPIPRQPEQEEDDAEPQPRSAEASVEDVEDIDEAAIAEESDSLSVPDSLYENSAELALLADSSLVADSTSIAEIDEQEHLNELLKQREFQMYRTMGDSLLAQGFDKLALQWYQSALQQDPDDSYVVEQIKRIEQTRAEIDAATAEADSLTQLINNLTDVNGIFFSSDIPPKMIDQKEVYKSIRFPRICQRLTNGGRVIARAIIDEEGNPSNMSISKSLHSACDKEVLSALSEAKFEPAVFNGEIVKSWYAFSVIFRQE